MDTALGIIAPHPPIMIEAVGGERSSVTEASLCAMHIARERLLAFAPDTLVVVSPHGPRPAHGFLVSIDEVLSGDLSGFGAAEAQYRVSPDLELAEAILGYAETSGLEVQGHRSGVLAGLDHGVVVPLSLLDPGGTCPIVAVSQGAASRDDNVTFGRAVRRAAEHLGRRVAFIASGDLSHRLTADAPAGYSASGADFDLAVVEAVRRGDLESLAMLPASLVEAAGQCGLLSFLQLSGFIGGRIRSEVLAYEGPWGVGYLTAVLTAPESPTPLRHGDKGGMPGLDESPHVTLARQVIGAYIAEGRTLAPVVEGELSARAAVFVSLHMGGELRGCIGTLAPTTPSVAEEITDMAIEAATNDPRFEPVGIDELDRLEISVDVLGDPEPVEDLGLLDPSVFGVIVCSGLRRGVLLPDLPGVDTVEQQLAIARRKAGIAPGEPTTVERFRVERHH